MPSFKSLALAATIATTAVAYSTPLEARSDLDFAPEDLDVLFGRDVEIDGEDLELLARDLDFSPEDMEILFARDPSLLSKGIGMAKSAFSSLSKHSGSLSKLGQGASTAMDVGSQYQAYKGQKLQNQQLNMQNQQMAAGGGGGGYTYRKRSLLDDDEELELLARDLGLDAEEVEMLIARAPTGFLSKASSLASKHGDTLRTGAHHGGSLFSAGANLAMTGQALYSQKLQNDQIKMQNKMMQQQGQGGAPQGAYPQGGAISGNYRRDLLEEDPEMWY